MVDRDIRYYMKLRKLRKKLQKLMRLPYTPAVQEEHMLLMQRIRAVERGDL